MRGVSDECEQDNVRRADWRPETSAAVHTTG